MCVWKDPFGTKTFARDCVSQSAKTKQKKPKTLNICNVAIEQSSDLGKDKHLSWPLVEKTKCLYHTSLFVQTSSESHTQKKNPSV